MKQDDLIEAIGIYQKTIKRNFSNGFSVFSFLCKNYDKYKQHGMLICKGKVPVLTYGIPLKITGYIKNGKLNNYYLSIETIEPFSNKEDNTIAYLMSDRFKGIGPKLAKNIVNYTGSNIFSFLQVEDASALLSANIKGLTQGKAEVLVDVVKETFFEKDIYEFIIPYGGNYDDARMLYEKYKLNAIDIFKMQPYEVGKELGIRFCICDLIAKDNDGSPDNEKRLMHLLFSTFYDEANNGSTYLTIGGVYHKVLRACKNSAFPEHSLSCSVIVCLLLNSKHIVSSYNENNEIIFTLKEFDDAENKIVNDINEFEKEKKEYTFDDDIEINEIEKELKIKYSDKQRETFHFLHSSGIKILTGGPGTGKTTTIEGIIRLYKKIHPYADIQLCAPTGRAAQRIKETTGHTAFTIHRLLNIKPYKKREETKYETDPILADMLIVDEFSMVDLKLFSLITSAMKKDATLILCGDTAQLPSVEAGNVLHDMINSRIFEVVELDVIHRQKDGSKIIQLAHNIKCGILPTCKDEKEKNITHNKHKIKMNFYDNNKEVQIIEVDSPQDICDTIIYTLKKKFLNNSSKFFVNNILNIQVLSSTKKESAGTAQLNKFIQEIYRDTNDENETLSVGDKVILTKNNYDVGYYNGDIGFVKNIAKDKNNESIAIEINDEIVTLKRDDIKDVSLCYACTIHKSQGSEYDYVIIALPNEPISILQRNLLYTAVTRAKKYVSIVFCGTAMSDCIMRDKTNKRNTNLKYKILKKDKGK